ncbi:MAG: RHS repeat-associated core domain-containing protein [Clostridia bacterium]|nr:RHS repeat-associated core domain-containing protein [Clostridia bacterium]
MAEIIGGSGASEIRVVYLYDEKGSPIGLKYRASTYAADTYLYYFFEKNLHGDIVAIYNQFGDKIATYSYDAWGACTTTTLVNGSTDKAIATTYNPFRYRGYYYDVETGWYYLQSRYYNPSWCRFINADSILGSGGFVGYNLFAYCNNNPVNGCDPCGTCFHRWDFWNDCESCGGKTIGEKADAVVKTVVRFCSPTVVREIHYNRNIINQVPTSEKEVPEDWKSSKDGGPGAACHQFSSPDNSNVKYVSPDGYCEVIFDKNGKLVTDPRDIGTFNYFPSDHYGLIGIIGHGYFDVLPWVIYGNSEDDTTTIFDRIFAFFGGGS